MSNEKRKVYFVQKNSKGAIETESLWCTKVGEDFIIDNIPFTAKRVSLGDTIRTEYDFDDKALYFEDFVAVSGNTTIRIFFSDLKQIGAVRTQLRDLGCETEAFLERLLVAVNVPKNVNYKPIKELLETGEKQKKWIYEESCLCHKY